MKKIAIAICCLSLVGCMPHLKEMDSFATNKEDSYSFPDGMKPMPEAGDPYTFSGIAGGSGGTIARQSYATDNNAPDFRDATGTGVTGEFDKDRTPTADPVSGAALPGTGSQFNGKSDPPATTTPDGKPAGTRSQLRISSQDGWRTVQ